MSFENIFNHKHQVKESANARVNLIGEHTDYTGGYVMPTLLGFKNTIQLSKNNNNVFEVYSEYFDEKKIFDDLIKSQSNEWVDYVKGCLFVFFDNYKNIKLEHFNIYISSTIPMERGISSSSALCVSTLKAINSYFNTQISEKQIAILAKKVEHDYIGVSGGIMDQMISSIGIYGKAFFLDCLSLEFELIDFPKDWKFCLVDSEVQRNLRSSSYNERFEDLKIAEKELNVENLGRVKVNDYLPSKFTNPIVGKRAKHVIFENYRVLKAKEYILNNNIIEFGNLMNESHLSYSFDFEASTKDVDNIVKNSIDCGALGSRLTGGGFGGFTVSLIKRDQFSNWYNKINQIYPSEKIFEV
tara:strand:- start:310 stop:1377 length:1068 start_codon:yes stop_codon:yes gene_type:complete